MRALCLIIFLSLSMHLLGLGQEIPKEFKKSNTMIIELVSNPDESLILIAKELVKFDFEIEKIDKEFLIVSTKPRLAKNILNYYIKVKVIDQKAEFQIYSSMDITIYGINSEGYSLTNFRGQKGSPNYEASMKLFSIVNSLNPEIQFLEK